LRLGSVVYFGEVAPKLFSNGASIGALPGEYEFDPGSGELTSEGHGGLKFGPGKVKIEGYGGQELIEIKHP
jgi:hypothetical protein